MGDAGRQEPRAGGCGRGVEQRVELDGLLSVSFFKCISQTTILKNINYDLN